MIQHWNTVIEYLSAKEATASRYDLAILAGNSLPYLADELIRLYENGLADRLMLVGGVGHATPFLQSNFKKMGMAITGASETEMYLDYFKQKYDLDKTLFLTEKTSTNSGENARFALDTVKTTNWHPEKVLLLADPLLQRRIKATFEKEWQATDAVFTNYVSIVPFVKAAENAIIFEKEQLNGLWSTDYFLSLVLGEIPRLRNDANGYGPNGRNYIDAVEIPKEVSQAYDKLCQVYAYEMKR
ncbi:ElyC/SanA/YdcF family protein [Candidatus Enterococcus lemimoniae]|uniref:DUF218 domain-containing protein n=1 Tax=Candidatus Enterococcus lemimoniae TaxID=1834167 RepID=A0ABZ2T1D8_9ENTE|nr:ElyC/SanA/YdcF family protein [Enterococcus sp. 12C11_DIV0727]OTO69553.1 hypothetical protein A5866_001769 [Enterococcus sp. 12C11_DIV0727]